MKPHRFNIGEKMDGFPAHTWNWLIDAVTALQNSQKRLENITRPTAFDNRGVVADFIVDRSKFGAIDSALEATQNGGKPIALGVGSIVGLMDCYGGNSGTQRHRRSGNIVLKAERPRMNNFDPNMGGASPRSSTGRYEFGAERDPILGVVIEVDPEMYAQGSASREHVGLDAGADVATGRALICGCAHVLLDVKDVEHEFAEVAPAWSKVIEDNDEHGPDVLQESKYGSIQGMRSCATGVDGVRILWKQRENEERKNALGIQQAAVLLQMAPSKVIDRYNMVWVDKACPGWDHHGSGKSHSSSCSLISYQGRPANYEELTEEDREPYDDGSVAKFYVNTGESGIFWNLSPHLIAPGPVAAMRIDPKGTSGAVFCGIPINAHAIVGFNHHANQSIGHDATSLGVYDNEHLGNTGASYDPGPAWQNDGSC